MRLQNEQLTYLFLPADMSSQQKPSQREVSPISTAAPAQGDNVAHALAGAGGGLLSMTLTLAPIFDTHQRTP